MDRVTKWFIAGFFVFLWLQIPPQIRNDIVNATFGALFAGIGTTVSTTASTVTPYTSRTVAEDTSVGSIVLAFAFAGILWFSLRGKVSPGGGGQRSSNNSGGGGSPQRSGGGGGGNSGGGGSPQRSGGGGGGIDYKAYLPYALIIAAIAVTAFTPFGQTLIASVNMSEIIGRVRSLIP